MDLQEKYSVLYRIIQGKLLYQQYVIYSPNIDILYDAQNFYNNIIEDYKYEPWLSIGDCLKYLVYNGICEVDVDIKLDRLNKQIEEYKINIYQSFFDSKKRQSLKQELILINETIEKLEESRHSLDYLTLQGFATILQQQYLLSKTTYNMNNQLVFNNLNSINFSLLHMINSYINMSQINIGDYRELARTEPWTSYWRISKENVFNKSSIQLTMEQRYLILYSKMYDGVFESSDEPSIDIVNDDDALDGWFLVQKNKRDADRKSKMTEDILNLQPNAQEVFIPAKTQEDINRIVDLNTIEGKIIKSQRHSMIDRLGVVEDSKLPDKQLEIRQKAMEQFKTGI